MIEPTIKKTGELVIVPYCCFRCRSVEKKYFLDTGIDTEMDGRIFICSDCIKDWIKVLPNVYSEKDYVDLQLEYRERIADADIKKKRYEFLVGKVKEQADELREIVKREEKALANERRNNAAVVAIFNGAEPELDDLAPRTEPDDSAIKLDGFTIDFTSSSVDATGGQSDSSV